MERRLRTLPEKERTDSTNRVTILDIDRHTNTVHMKVNGFSVSVICQEHDNTEIYDRVKGILLDTIIGYWALHNLTQNDNYEKIMIGRIQYAP